MARRTTPIPLKQPANLSAGDIRAAIPKLKRRLDEVDAFEPEKFHDPFDPATKSICNRIEDTLIAVFGSNSLEYERYGVTDLYSGALYMGHQPSPQEVLEGYRDGKTEAREKLVTAISMLEERLADMGEAGTAGVPRSLQGNDLHAAIEAAAGQLFRDGHYANAVENACKALNGLIQARSGVHDTDNTDLAQRIFSPKNPRLTFNDLADETDRSEQQGMMQLYAGAFLALRNPRAHKLVDDDPKVAYGAILTINFLAEMVARTNIR